MWLSKTINKNTSDSRAQRGNVTISGSAEIEAHTGGNTKSMDSYTPYGYICAAPVGEEVAVIPSSDGVIALGTKCKAGALKSGEVMLTSLGGATVYLKNDGSVVINSLVIDKNGVIVNG